MPTQRPEKTLADVVLDPDLYRLAILRQDGPDRITATLPTGHVVRLVRKSRAWKVGLDVSVTDTITGLSASLVVCATPEKHPEVVTLWSRLQDAAYAADDAERAKLANAFHRAAVSLYLEARQHVHTRDCYDDPGPGHGSPSMICPNQDAPR